MITDLVQPKSFIFLVRVRGDIKVWENDYSDKSSYLAVGCNYSQNSSTTGDEGTVVLCQVSIHPLKNEQSPCQQLRFLSEAWQLHVFVTITWITSLAKGQSSFNSQNLFPEYQFLLVFSENMFYVFMAGKIEILIYIY